MTLHRTSQKLGKKCVTMFPLENLPRDQHLIDPDVHYRAFDKTFIPEITCAQPEVIGIYDAASDEQRRTATRENGENVDILSGEGVNEYLPCIVKATHSDAGYASYIINDMGEYHQAVDTIRKREPLSSILVTKLVENIMLDCACHMYIHQNGDVKFLSINEQMIENAFFKGGFIDMRPEAQKKLQTLMAPALTQVKDKLHQIGYFGVCSVDILVDQAGDLYVIDINPRIGFGFIMASLKSIMTARGWTHALSPSTVTHQGSLAQLISDVKQCTDGEILIVGFSETKRSNMVQAIVFSTSLPDCINIAKQYFNFE